MTRIFHTQQIALPVSVKYADCEPVVVTNRTKLENAYLAANYTPRSAWYCFEKGPIPPPFSIRLNNTGALYNEYSVFFNNFSGTDCPSFICNLSCNSQDISFITGGVTGSVQTFCLNGDRPTYNFTVAYSSTGERLGLPARFKFMYEDSIGNTAEEEVESISSIKPIAPIVGHETIDGIEKVYIGVILLTNTYYEISETNDLQFIIEKSRWPDKTNVHTFKGYYNSLGSNRIFEDKAASGDVVGYRLRLKNKWDENSQYSDWTVISL